MRRRLFPVILAGTPADTTAPSVSTFTVNSPANSLDVPIAAFTASEAGVSFIITENSTPPAVDAAGWSETAPETYTVSSAGTYTLYPWVKDAAGNISAEYGSPATVVVFVLPFSDAFTRGDGAIGGQWTGATWTIASNAALNTPTAGGELWDAAASTFESGTYNWTAYGSNVVTNDGNQLKIAYGSAYQGAYNYLKDASDLSANLTVGQWYQLSVQARVDSGNSCGVAYNNNAGGAESVKTVTETDLTTKVLTFRGVHATDSYVNMTAMDAGEIIWLDNISLKPFTTSSLFATVPSGTASVTAQVVITVFSGNQAGLALNLDSATTPQNFVIAYLEIGAASACKLDKCVNGTYTNLINVAATFGATKNLKLVKNGDSYSVYYGTPGSEAQMGTTQTISGMSGTIHGLFSTNSGVKFDTYQLAAT